MYAVQVSLGSAETTIVWNDDGSLGGDPIIAGILDMERDSREVIRGPEGMWWAGKDKQDGNALWWLLQELFDSVEFLSGEMPPGPTVPEGFVG